MNKKIEEKETETRHLDKITLYDEDGNPVDFEVIASLKLDEQEYFIVQFEENKEYKGDEDVLEILIFRVSENNDEFIFDYVESEDEISEVLDAYHSLLNE